MVISVRLKNTPIMGWITKMNSESARTSLNFNVWHVYQLIYQINICGIISVLFLDAPISKRNIIFWFTELPAWTDFSKWINWTQPLYNKPRNKICFWQTNKFHEIQVTAIKKVSCAEQKYNDIACDNLYNVLVTFDSTEPLSINVILHSHGILLRSSTLP